MCFSATASFVAGGALSAAGVVTLKSVRQKRELPLASIPLLLGIQQLTEGFVWMSLMYSEAALNAIATHIYYVFAHIWWPVFIPIAVALIEPVPQRRRMMWVLEAVGILVGGYFVNMMATRPITSSILNDSIVYSHPGIYVYHVLALYVLVVCGSFLLSSKRLINLLGVLLAVAFAVCFFFYFAVLASVWCFFAAVLSIVIYVYFLDQGSKRTPHVR
ncbi:hypothetical protein HZC00_04090 [Candidatus Kaiserbacteria bacterium]|nr:hypothetical protein [Candidatus Kaiserbacteria bacterium]